jgi:PAS domain S-box-containing protein
MGIWTWDVDSDIQTRDANYNRLLGLHRVESREPFEEFLNQCVHPDDREAVAAAFAASVACGQKLMLEYRVVRPDGEVRWLRDQGDIFGTVKGLSPQMAGACVDVTDLKQAEQTARVQTAKVHRLVDSNIIGVLFADLERITDANDAFLEMVGHSRADLEAGLLRWREMTPPEHLPADERALEEMRRRGACTPFQKEYFRKDGSRVPILLGAATIDPAVPTWACFVQDMSKVKEFENELREADRRKDEFLAMLAHELRNPLAPIINATSLMVQCTDDPETLEWAGDVIQRQVQHLTTLVDDLLDVSRITRGKITLEPAPLDVSAFVLAAVEASRPIIDGRRHRLDLEMAREPLRVEGDLTRLTQVVTNLLNNAAKYTPEGGHIRLAVGREGDEAVVTIRDDGFGIPQEMLSQVFDLFTQLEQTLDRSQGGLGIGLTLARRLVEMHGGTVEARSDGPGRGSEFSVRLPLLPEAGPGSRANGHHDFAAAPEARRRRILVVDDNRDAAETLVRFLRLEGHQVELAFDGPSACEAAAALTPDIVLLDIGLPGLNGYEVARRLRGEASTSSATIVAVSGYGQDADRRKSEAAGFDHHLVKPVDLRKLSALITQAGPRAASASTVS